MNNQKKRNIELIEPFSWYIADDLYLVEETGAFEIYEEPRQSGEDPLLAFDQDEYGWSGHNGYSAYDEDGKYNEELEAIDKEIADIVQEQFLRKIKELIEEDKLTLTTFHKVEVKVDKVKEHLEWVSETYYNHYKNVQGVDVFGFRVNGYTPLFRHPSNLQVLVLSNCNIEKE